MIVVSREGESGVVRVGEGGAKKLIKQNPIIHHKNSFDQENHYSI